MGNATSTSSPSKSRRSGSSGGRRSESAADLAAERAKRVVGDLQEGIKASVKKLDDDHPAAQFFDTMCGAYFEEEKYREKYRDSRSASYYSEDVSEDGSRTFQSEDDTTYDGRRGGRRSDKSVESASYTTQSEYDSDSRRGGRRRNDSFETEEESRITQDEPKLISKPLASSFAKRCYFTKAGIGKTTQHYEGLTLTGNVVLMLASAMKLKGCPTICDEDLRRVEQTYPNQFSRLPDELLLSSGWRRISKYCHFSNKPIPDGIPFFHSKQRLNPSGGYYFLLAAAVGMIRPLDVEPLTKDTLVLLETDFPNQCDSTPSVLIRDPEQWVLVNKFCFFSGGPINTEEDVYYQADFDGNPIYMLAFLSPSLTPEELYKLTEVGPNNEPGLRTVGEVQNVESVYDLTDRDFDDLKLYHLGPCRALPQYILQPSAWTKVLPPHFLAARQQAMLRAHDFEGRFDTESGFMPASADYVSMQLAQDESNIVVPPDEGDYAEEQDQYEEEVSGHEFQREVEEEGAFHITNSIDNYMSQDEDSFHANSGSLIKENVTTSSSRLDPPDDEPPSLKKGSMEEIYEELQQQPISTPPGASVDEHGFFSMQQQKLEVSTLQNPDNYPEQYVSPESYTQHQSDCYVDEEPTPVIPQEYFEDTPRLHEHEEYFDDAPRSPGAAEYYDDDGPVDPRDLGIVGSPYAQSTLVDEQFYASEEKKSVEKEEIDSQVENSVEFVNKDSEEQSAGRFVETSFTEYNGPAGDHPFSPAEASANSQSHQSPAMRGAHEILKKRRQRFEMMLAAGQQQDEMSATSIDANENPNPAASEASVDAWEESGSEFTGSAISAGSSAWTENSGPADRTSRRALILQMARARMKNNKESPSKQRIAPAISEEDASKTVATDGNATADFDLTGDLD